MNKSSAISGLKYYSRANKSTRGSLVKLANAKREQKKQTRDTASPHNGWPILRPTVAIACTERVVNNPSLCREEPRAALQRVFLFISVLFIRVSLLLTYFAIGRLIAVVLGESQRITYILKIQEMAKKKTLDHKFGRPCSA